MNILECALRMEHEARDNYRKLAQKVSQPELKQLFTLLASAEEEHGDAIIKITSSLDTSAIEFHALSGMDCVFKPPLDADNLSAELADDLDAYKHIVNEEKESVRFYEEMLDKTDDNQTLDVLKRLLKEERKHLGIVEGIYSFVESPKTFLASAEFSNLKQL